MSIEQLRQEALKQKAKENRKYEQLSALMQEKRSLKK